MGQQSDLELLAAWREGDQAAGNALVKRHFRAVYGFFRNKFDGDIDDLIQRTFLGCVEARDRFAEQSSFRTYLFAIARNQLYDALRRRARGRNCDFATMSMDDLHDIARGPADEVEGTEQRRLLLRGLRRIPLDDQIALELYYWQELSAREVGEALGLPEANVRSRIFRAKGRLRDALAQLTTDAGLLASTMDDFDRWAADMRLQAAQ